MKYPTLIFHQSKCKNKSDLVYNNGLTAGDVLDESIHPNESSTVDESSQDELSQDEPPSYSHSYIENRELYHSAMFLRGILSKIENNLPWPPDSNDLKYESIAEDHTKYIHRACSNCFQEHCINCFQIWVQTY